ncbi:MAG TPA: sugar phosphate isomerase/epimerase family protein [Bryobacteraceae bacterium]|nr:sugar phosphate isomerase/epimerase family protein [Bryobacteraceae bacterium]HOQ45668.1 sugar phosphate isomerase/epimerase family protein [Bryobacteraceae bacterium]HPQ16332.1 sugar phosphate isomerase/epimerase family protein [Bryobacteraceae bacterium]HPU71606.1 sugar phosphate isomerase/epimerase family protein [Bryobacteraceae bacterium]
MLTRRTLLAATAAAAFGRHAAAKKSGLRIGVMDGCFKLEGNVEAVERAAALGFEGLQITIGRAKPGGALPLSNPGLQGAFLAASKRHKMPIGSTYLDILHVNCLKNDELAKKWVLDGIEITRKLDAKILMLVFFGKCALTTTNQQEIDAVTAALKELAPAAEKAGVILGFENTLPAEANARVLDRVGSNALKVYYDVGNTTNQGYDAPKEIRWLGKDRICQFHFKDRGYMGEGKVDFPAVMRAIEEIGFTGYAMLETSAPSGNIENDLRRNLSFVRKLMDA